MVSALALVEPVKQMLRTALWKPRPVVGHRNKDISLLFPHRHSHLGPGIPDTVGHHIGELQEHGVSNDLMLLPRLKYQLYVF